MNKNKITSLLLVGCIIGQVTSVFSQEVNAYEYDRI